MNGQRYVEMCSESLRPLKAFWPLDNIFQLGDYGEWDDHYFHRIGNIKNLGYRFSEMSTTAGTYHLCEGARSTVVDGADVSIDGDKIGLPVGKVRSALRVQFEREAGLIVSFADCISAEMLSLIGLDTAIRSWLRRYGEDSSVWNRKYAVLTHTIVARKSLVICGNERGTSVELTASGNVSPGHDIASANIEWGFRNADSSVYTYTSNEPRVVLGRFMALQRRGLWRHDERLSLVRLGDEGKQPVGEPGAEEWVLDWVV